MSRTPVFDAVAHAMRIAIGGGALAGLACADELRAKGHAATRCEANRRLGGGA